MAERRASSFRHSPVQIRTVPEIFARSKESPWARLSLGEVRSKLSRGEVHEGEDWCGEGAQAQESPIRIEDVSRLARLERTSSTASEGNAEFCQLRDPAKGA